MKTVLSGIQPTGNLHLGNYLGSIQNWLDLQDSHQCLFGIMDLHAITVPQDPKDLKQSVFDVAAIYLACGLDPKKSAIFVQSQVPSHLELSWIFSTLTPMGWLNRMTQFKSKAKINYSDHLGDMKKMFYEVMGDDDVSEHFKKVFLERFEKVVLKDPKDAGLSKYIDAFERGRFDSANLGLYAYPVLMAADILLYKSDLVPVGDDQKQHLELTRDLAGAFNRRFKTDYFKLPEPMIMKLSKRIMSLQDGSSKMSKSDESDLSRINLNDDENLIIKKIKKAKTDSQSIISYDEGRPEIYNLLNIFSLCSGQSPEDLAKTYENSGFGKFKGDLAESLVAKLAPLTNNLKELKQDKSYIEQILKDGKEQAEEIASKTKREIFEIVGLS